LRTFLALCGKLLYRKYKKIPYYSWILFGEM
jgi:hypothetical protein